MATNQSVSKTGAIFLATHSRPTELRNCLKSVTEQAGDIKPIVVVLCQRGNPEVQAVINEYKNRIHYLVEINAMGKTPLENINFNRILGYQICFDYLKVDWVLAIEEDTVISKDGFIFCQQMIERYWNYSRFRGVNLGSFEIVNEKHRNTYSKLSYGLHGQAGAITSKTWKKLPKSQLIIKSNAAGFDAQVENYLKRGFFITSNSSRYLDFGWNGTHASNNPNNEYYLRLNQSWVGADYSVSNEFQLLQIRHNWRSDVMKYGFKSILLNSFKHWYFSIKKPGIRI